MGSPARITNDGDWEVVLLSEAHSALAGIISPFLYSVQGEAPDQNVWFKSSEHFDLFLIRLVELFAAGQRLVQIDGRSRDVSLVDGLRWFSKQYPGESSAAGLDRALHDLQTWVDAEPPLKFWCAALQRHIEFSLSRRDLIWFGGNCAKHGMLRLSNLFDKLERRLESASISLGPPELIAVLEDLDAEVVSRLEYHSTRIAELLGHVFAALNRIVLARFQANPTNRVAHMQMPCGTTSDIFKDIYGSVLIFKRYDEQERILTLTPVTSKYLQMRF